MTTAGFTGRNPGDMAGLCDFLAAGAVAGDRHHPADPHHRRAHRLRAGRATPSWRSSPGDDGRFGRSGTPALFLDRDGVINLDKGYVGRVEDFEFLPGIFELARFAVHELGWPLVVVSNQSGIGRGYFDEDAYQRLTDWMCERFRAEQAPIARVYHCPYHPTHGIGAYRADHDWRKPKPGMILQAATDLNLDLSRSVLIGDKFRRYRGRRGGRRAAPHSHRSTKRAPARWRAGASRGPRSDRRAVDRTCATRGLRRIGHSHTARSAARLRSWSDNVSRQVP